MKTAEVTTEAITSKFERDGLNLNKCRGQLYDNQDLFLMASIYSGVQKRISDLNPLTLFVPSSLNLVGVHADHVNVHTVNQRNKLHSSTDSFGDTMRQIKSLEK